MHDSLLAAHEFRLRLKCIYDVQPCSPCPQAPKAGGDSGECPQEIYTRPPGKNSYLRFPKAVV
jgi:hypothetical protein